MNPLEKILVFMSAAVILVGVAQRLRIPYPLALVVGGMAIGFMPAMNPFSFDPNLILLIVLPPILYYVSFWIPFREFKKNWRDIFSLALGLVAATTLIVGLIFKCLFPEFSWALAFAFGAIVSPPDATAVSSILKRFNINDRLMNILEGESMINDASGLVLYRIAVTALFSGVFSFSEAVVEFVKVVSGGLIIGSVIGYLLHIFSRRYFEPIVGVIFSFMIPYLTYIAADAAGGSGVLAVVVSGLMGSRFLLTHPSSLRRIIAFSVWDIFFILLNCFVFILIGSELGAILGEFSKEEILLYMGYGTLITLALIGLRMAWAFAMQFFKNYFEWGYAKGEVKPRHPYSNALIIGWAGMRGIVSLSAALALPLIIYGDAPLKGRPEAIFITFVVIFLTLLIPGLSLPSLIKWLNIPQTTEERAEKKIREALVKAAKEEIERLHQLQNLNDDECSFLLSYFNAKHRLLESISYLNSDAQRLEKARLEIIRSQRQILIGLWERGEVEDKLHMQLEHELDVEEVRIVRANL